MKAGALAAGAATALLLAGFAAVSADGLWRPDAFDYAQIARELAEGRGFSSRQAIYALHLEFLRSQGLLESDWPNLHRFPLPPLLMAAGFRLFGAVDAVVIGYGIVFQAATAALLFGWARAAIGLLPAVGCVILFAANGTLLEIGTSGLAEPPALCFFTLALFSTWWQRRSVGLAPSWVCGASLGLATLARTNVLFVAPLVLVALAAARRGSRGTRDLRAPAVAAAVALLALVAVAGPWWVRNQVVAGDPFFSLHTYFLLPSGTGPGGGKWDLSVPWVTHFKPPLAYLAEHPGAVAGKWWSNLLRLLRALPTFGDTLGVVPVAAAAVFAVAGAGLRPVARLWAAAFVLNALLVSFTDQYLPKYHVHFLPVAMLLATGVVWQLLDRLRGRWLRPLLFACAVVAMADPSGAVRALRRVPASAARFDRAHWEVIRREVPARAVVMSDQSYAVSWETGRRSVRLHYDRTDDGQLVLGVLAISDAYLPIDAVYLSRQFLRDPAGLEILNRTLERQPRFRREFPRMLQLEGGGLLFLR